MIKVLKEVTIEDLEKFIYQIDETDPNLYKEVNNPNKIGIFQISAGTAERLCAEIQPSNFEELTAVNALSRPGPLEAAAPIYIERKNTGEHSDYPDIMRDILKDTYEVFVYQEQIMEVSQKIGGFTLDEANELRGVMKKLAKAEKKEEDLKKWDKIVKKFTKNAIALGIEETMAKKVADDMVAFSGYSFNRSHAASYTFVALITLYLSYYFRKYYYSAVLNYESDKGDYLLDRVISVRKQGMQILPPDINHSHSGFYPEDDGSIRFGLGNIKFVSTKALEKILPERPFSSMFDFIIKTRARAVTIKVIHALISVGVFDTFLDKKSSEIDTRKKLLHVIDIFWENKKSTKIEEKLKLIYEKARQQIIATPAIVETEDDLIAYEKEFFGAKIFTSQFTDEVIKKLDVLEQRKLIHKSLRDVSPASKKVPVVVRTIKNWTDKNDNAMAFIDVEDVNGDTASFPIFASLWKFIGDEFFPEKLYLLNLYKDNKGKIMFGQKTWVSGENRIKRLVRMI